MSAIRTWDFYCESCETAHKDIVYTGRRPKTILCGCGARAGWGFVQKNQIHHTHTGRKYGQFDPQFGCVVEDYAHKQALLKRYGKEELPPETHEQIAEDMHEQEERARRVAPRDPDTLIADSLDELSAQIMDKIDTRHTGERQLNRLLGGDLIDSAYGIDHNTEDK